MALDPITLSSLVVVNSLVFTILWSVAAFRFPNLKNIRYWMVAGILASVGAIGILIAPADSLMRIVWQVSVVAGYGFYAMGVRVFHGATPGMVPGLALMLTTSLVLVLLQGNPGLTEAIAIVTPLLPLVATIVFLARRERRSAGAAIAGVAMAVSILGHLLLAGINIASNGAPDATAVATMTYVLLVLIYSVTIWNFGFALMTIERFFTMASVLARTDHLTGAANRREFEERLATEVARSEATGHACCVIMVDVDHFKHLNDRHGHAWGDRALVHLVQCMKSRARDTDLVARLGGDEFALLLPHTKAHLADDIANQIAQTLRQSPVIWNGERVGYHVSIGVAAWAPGVETHMLTDSADAALYAAKAAGRDTVRSATTPAPRHNNVRPIRTLAEHTNGRFTTPI